MPRPVSTVVELKCLPRTAEEWCARLHSSDVSASDRTAFEAWIAASPGNRASYELCALTFAVSRGLAGNADLRSRLALPQSGVMPSSATGRGRLRQKRTVAMAACAAGLLAAVAVVLWRLMAPAYSSDVGEQKLVTLADGSTVQLNTATAIGVDLQPQQRRVTLRQGEAFFSVAPDPSRPFIVEAGDSEIRVIGTKFNVRIDDRGVALVTVLEGRVKVLNPHVGESRTAVRPAIQDLSSGESAAVAPEVSAVRVAAVNPAKLASWREGRIYFDRDPLSKVIEEINRYSETRFVIHDPGVSALTLSGVFRTGDTDSVAFALRESYGLDTRRDGRQIEIVRAAAGPGGTD